MITAVIFLVVCVVALSALGIMAWAWYIVGDR